MSKDLRVWADAEHLLTEVMYGIGGTFCALLGVSFKWYFIIRPASTLTECGAISNRSRGIFP